ncbi:gephyrin-like molybdotransferase receptor GlpR [Nocardia sp. NPDC050630]|uniref:divisome protein SepX/GlpR n=1 Tax=Nocardia sp. NPDC050630 TaxID=3364321 RepID=UPI0037AE50C9
MPNSILWIGLVVLWVFVLFPILADRHPRIRQTTDAALATRVLHRGGSKRRTKSGPAAGHDSDPDYRPTRVHRKLSHSDDAEDRMAPPADEQVTEDDNPADTPPEAESAISDAESDEFDSAEAEFADDAEELDAADSDDAEIATARTAAKQRVSADDDRVALEHTESTGARIPPARTAAPAGLDESGSDDSDFVPTRRGRGGFDPEADAIARAARYTFRQRAVLGLVLAALAFGGLSVALSPMFWWGCGGSALVLVSYLAYLRKQVRMEEEIRRRRLARLARSRGEHIEAEREAEQRAQQRVMDRDTARALRRRSVLIEVDDEDPMFEHLETFDPATARALRRSTGDIRRAAGA